MNYRTVTAFALREKELQQATAQASDEIWDASDYPGTALGI